MKIAGCQPDSGNPTVRDERGAYGNVSYGGIRNPLHKLKRCMSETLCLRLRAPYFYPTLWEIEEGRGWLSRLGVATLFIFGLKRGVGAEALSEFFGRLRLLMLVVRLMP